MYSNEQKISHLARHRFVQGVIPQIQCNEPWETDEGD